jgi:hypothetical protein
VTNTFIAAGGGDLIGTDTNGNKGEFVLKEHKVQTNASGAYEYAKDDENELIEVAQNEYKVLPGVDLPKDPFVRITEKSEAPAYLYVEVVESENFAADKANGVFSYSIDSSWLKLNGVTGTNGGAVYVYKGTGSAAAAITNETTGLDDGINIIANQKIQVADKEISENDSLTFYGYLAQASITTTEGTSSDAAVIYNTCFVSNQSAD